MEMDIVDAGSGLSRQPRNVVMLNIVGTLAEELRLILLRTR